MALADHDYTAVEVVAEAMEAMEVNEEVDNQGRRGEKTAEALSSIAKAAEAEDESGVDLGFDALMNLEENNDLAQFMQCGDIRLLWNLADMSGVRSTMVVRYETRLQEDLCLVFTYRSEKP